MLVRGNISSDMGNIMEGLDFVHSGGWRKGVSDAARDWGQEEKGMTENEMAGWHH